MLVWDTSALIDLWNAYPIDVFPSLWQRFMLSLRDGESTSVRDVHDELKRRSDTLVHWCEANWTHWVDLEEDVQRALVVVMEKCPTITTTTGLSDAADPIVVALAYARRGAVVSSEKRIRGTGAQKVKIPDACDLLEVTHLDVVGALRQLRYSS